MQLDIQNLTHRYNKNKIALDNISLKLKPGIIGLLGPNGAGKSTLMRILATLNKPTEGSVLWNDNNILNKPEILRKELGYLPQSFGVYENLTAVEFLLYLASLKGLSTDSAYKKVNELLEMLNLVDAKDLALKGFSGGMKQRVGIAQALLTDPTLLIVDEPTVGLDPEERARFRHLLADLSGDRVIIFSTHIVSDIESIADQIAILNNGKLLAFNTPEALQQQIEDSVWEVTVEHSEVRALQKRFCITHSLRRTDGFHLRITSKEQPLANAKHVEPCLEDAFLFYTQAVREEETV